MTVKAMSRHFCHTPLGRITFTLQEAWLVELSLPGRADNGTARPADSGLAGEVARQLLAWSADPHFVFSLPLAPAGSAFRQRVWSALRAIPPGEVRTYGELARRLGSSARAVGGACRANPLPLVVPCHRVVAAGGLGGFAGHRDGAALALPHRDPPAESASLLAVAVLLHRLPIGVALGWILVPHRGWLAALSAATLVGAATVGGFILGAPQIAALPVGGLAIFQALVAGTLLHVVFDHAHGPAPRGRQAGFATLGGLLGAAALGLLFFERADPGHPAMGPATGAAFLRLALEAAPALLLGFLGAGLVRVFLRPRTLTWLARGRALTRSLKGVVFGLPLPICSCGVVPVYRGLIRAGVPATAAMSFLVATPEIGLDALAISVPLLGLDLTLLRVGAAALVALAVGSLVGSAVDHRSPPVAQDTAAEPAARSLRRRLRVGLRFGFVETVDETLPWILFGLVLAGLFESALRPGLLGSLPGALEVLIWALIGVPTYVCASGSTPLVAVLLLKGLSPGAALAFLLTGPATNVTSFGVLRDLHGATAAVVFGVVMLALTVGLGVGVNLLVPGVGQGGAFAGGEHEPTALQIACVGILGLLLLSSLLRQGPRGMIAQIVPRWGSEEGFGEEEAEAHDHASCCN